MESCKIMTACVVHAEHSKYMLLYRSYDNVFYDFKYPPVRFFFRADTFGVSRQGIYLTADEVSISFKCTLLALSVLSHHDGRFAPHSIQKFTYHSSVEMAYDRNISFLALIAGLYSISKLK